MNKVLEEIDIKINANKEVLETLPKNNEKNIIAYVQKVNGLQEEFGEYEASILKEMKTRVDRVCKIKEDDEIEEIKKELAGIENILPLLNETKTSFEQMNFDKAMHKLRYYYRDRLETVNEAIFYSIKKFREVGVALRLEDFCYSKYVREYLTLFFAELASDSIDYKKLQSKFEEIYWECSNLIMYIEINMRYIYLKNEKTIDKYYAKEKERQDKAHIIDALIEGKINPKDHIGKIVEDRYSKFVAKDIIEAADEDKINEIDANIKQLANSIYEYKNYLKFKFIIDSVKKIYEEKDQYKNVYVQTKKQIASKEKEIIKLNSKIGDKGILKKANDKLISQQENLIMEVKKLYRELDENKIKDTVLMKLNDNPTISDALNLASSFYNYLVFCIRERDKELSEEELEKAIEKIREFVKWPYATIINKIGLIEEKDLLLLIKDRYQLLNINISREDLDTDNLDVLVVITGNIETGHNIRINKIDAEEIGYVCEFKKILEDK